MRLNFETHFELMEITTSNLPAIVAAATFAAVIGVILTERLHLSIGTC